MSLPARFGPGLDDRALAGPVRLKRGEPLWKIVPKRDADGKPYCDFMMLAPGLNRQSGKDIESFMLVVRGVLGQFGGAVVFADFNLSLNVLWVSYRYQPGLMSQMVAVLRDKLPMLRLVAHNPPS